MISDQHKISWTLLHKFAVACSLIFVSLFIVSFSFPHEIIPDIGNYTSPLFEGIAKWFGDTILQIKRPYISELISDSTGFYINALVILIFSIVATTVFLSFYKNKINWEKLQYWLTVICRYYLAMQLLGYGFNKVFKAQFYLPEPNTLFTTMGNTPRDLLYWSAIGTSRAYNIFMGSMELLAALLLLFRKTSLLGAIFSFGIMVNVVAINFSFDISVKLYSIFLLFLCVIIFAPYLRMIYHFVIQRKSSERRFIYTEKRNKILAGIKVCIVILIFIDALLPYIRSNNYNDDKLARPPFHGAYDVKSFNWQGIEREANLNDTLRWKRVFMHREGYFIIEFMNEDMKDLKLNLDKQNQLLHLTDYDSSRIDLHFIYSGNALTEISGKINGNEMKAVLEKIDLQKLQLLQNEFHWTIDEIND